MQRDDNGSTALFQARSAEVVCTLVRAGADIGAVDGWGKDPLATVLDEAGVEGGTACGSLRPDLLAVARALLDAGAPPERAPGRPSSRLYDASFTHNADAVEFLLGRGLRPAADSHLGSTPLHAIAWQGGCDIPTQDAAWERILRALVAAGNPVDARDGRGRTPLDEVHGGDGRNDTAIRVLLELGADPRERAE